MRLERWFSTSMLQRTMQWAVNIVESLKNYFHRNGIGLASVAAIKDRVTAIP